RARRRPALPPRARDRERHVVLAVGPGRCTAVARGRGARGPRAQARARGPARVTTLTAMRIVIAGAHGQIGLRLVRLLAARGDEVVGLIRNPAHAEDITAAGGTPVVCDLENASAQQVADAIG